MRRLAFGPIVGLLLVGPLAAQTRRDPVSLIIGTWHGTSICVDPRTDTACQDEEVIYEVDAPSGAEGPVRLHMDKVVHGMREDMGTFNLTYDAGTSGWSVDLATRIQARWSFHPFGGDWLIGDLHELPSKRLVRRVDARRPRFFKESDLAVGTPLEITPLEVRLMAASVDEIVAAHADSTALCLQIMGDERGPTPPTPALIDAVRSRRAVTSMSGCPRTYTSMVQYVDSLGRPIGDRAPEGYVDPYHFHVGRPQFEGLLYAWVYVRLFQGRRRACAASVFPLRFGRQGEMLAGLA